MVSVRVWPEQWKSVYITVKPVKGIYGGGETVADNAAVVSVINTGSSKCEQVMHLMSSLVFFRANGNIFLIAKHIPGWTMWQKTHYPVITCCPGSITGIRGATSGLDITELDKIAGSLFAKGLAESSQRTYRRSEPIFNFLCIR